MSVTPADQLRVRATTLRSFARRVQQLEVVALYARAGGDTWLGASPQACEEALRAARTRLFTEVDTLMATARRLEREADSLGPQ